MFLAILNGNLNSDPNERNFELSVQPKTKLQTLVFEWKWSQKEEVRNTFVVLRSRVGIIALFSHNPVQLPGITNSISDGTANFQPHCFCGGGRGRTGGKGGGEGRNSIAVVFVCFVRRVSRSSSGRQFQELDFDFSPKTKKSELMFS